MTNSKSTSMISPSTRISPTRVALLIFRLDSHDKWISRPTLIISQLCNINPGEKLSQFYWWILSCRIKSGEPMFWLVILYHLFSVRSRRLKMDWMYKISFLSSSLMCFNSLMKSVLEYYYLYFLSKLRWFWKTNFPPIITPTQNNLSRI